ncbi:hypothetical protein ALC57_17929 [Trachymyrmex cornetzi]|uniref:Uncharacterized protein n=1 Tax=Trachymyrmex cornetzi TaxID=471704 RepID=A0A195DAQ4_9HYME|nr:hypothetical protein ALC57_17929 [Trachymyrmex cornetzi]
MSLEMAKSLFPRRDPRWPNQHIYERHFVPDEVGVYVCEQHRPVGLEVPEAFWNDVVGRGRFGRGALRIRQRPRPEPRLVPLISALANCSIILDGRWPIGLKPAYVSAVRIERIVTSSRRLPKRRELVGQRRVDVGWRKGRGRRWMTMVAGGGPVDDVCAGNGGGSGEWWWW